MQRLCGEGLLERRLYQDRPPRYEYAPTQKARELFPVLNALIQWGDRCYAPNGPPRLILHRGCGGTIVEKTCCDRCGAEVSMDQVEAKPGPGTGIRFSR